MPTRPPKPPSAAMKARLTRSAAWAVSLFWLACGGDDLTAPPTGQITVTTSTSGPEQDPDGYTVSLDDQPGETIEINGSRTLSTASGDHTVEIGGLAANCSVQGDTRQAVQVAGGEVTAVDFEVVCRETAGGLRVVAATTGGGQDTDGYSFTVDQGEAQAIGANDAVTVTALPAGNHEVLLSGVADNCGVAGPNPRTATVAAGEVVELTFEIACSAGVQRWTEMSSGTNADLPDVWGTSGSDVFVVGEVPIDDDFEISSVILRFDGSRWTRQLLETDLVLRAVWGSSTTSVYAVGFDFFTSDAKVLSYDGTRWSDVPGFESGRFEQLALLSVWGSSASDVFAVGSVFDGVERSLIFHFDGSSWQRMPQPSPSAPALVDIWGSSARDVYAVGRDAVADPGTGVILRYDGAVWSPVVEDEELVPTSVWGSSSSDVFVAGFRVEEVGNDFRVSGTILHYDGASWSRMSIPSSEILHGIWGTSATDVFAVGEEGIVLHYDGTSWTKSNPTANTLLGVWGSSPSDVFAVGIAGTILRGTP